MKKKKTKPKSFLETRISKRESIASSSIKSQGIFCPINKAYIWIKGTDKIIERQLVDSPKGGKEWLLLGIIIAIDTGIKIKDIKNIFDSGDATDELPPSKQSYFKFEINRNTFLDIPLCWIKTELKIQDIFSSNKKLNFTNCIAFKWNDKIRMTLKFWDDKPRDYVKVYGHLKKA